MQVSHEGPEPEPELEPEPETEFFFFCFQIPGSRCPPVVSGLESQHSAEIRSTKSIDGAIGTKFCLSSFLHLCHSSIPPFCHAAILPSCHSLNLSFRHSAILLCTRGKGCGTLATSRVECHF